VYFMVMEYVEGDTLSRIVARTMSLGQMPPRHVVLRMVLDALAGLHAAHELRDDRGQLLGLVHRDCSPQNVLVGVDGTARITDFGVARASSRLTSTAHGKLKGKLAYMAPEQTRGDELDRRTDLFAMGIIVWEVLCGKRLFKADSEAATLQRILVEPIRPPSEINPTIPKCFDAVLMRALDRDQERRYQTAADFADALEAAARESAKANVTDIGGRVAARGRELRADGPGSGDRRTARERPRVVGAERLGAAAGHRRRVRSPGRAPRGRRHGARPEEPRRGRRATGDADRPEPAPGEP
jgi:serine/threonine protein kinase